MNRYRMHAGRNFWHLFLIFSVLMISFLELRWSLRVFMWPSFNFSFFHLWFSNYMEISKNLKIPVLTVHKVIKAFPQGLYVQRPKRTPLLNKRHKWSLWNAFFVFRLINSLMKSEDESFFFKNEVLGDGFGSFSRTIAHNHQPKQTVLNWLAMSHDLHPIENH